MTWERCPGWGIFLLCFPFLEGTAQVTGAALDKINCTKAINNYPERKVSHVLWMNTVYFLSVEVSEQILFLDLDPSNLSFVLFGIIFFLSEIKETNRRGKTSEVGKQYQSTQEWSLHQALWALILFLTFQSHSRFLSSCCFCPDILVPINKNYERHNLHVGAGLSRFITHSY